MKRLIVLTLQLTLLALLPGCSILANRANQPCDTTSSLPSASQGHKGLFSFLPWNRRSHEECTVCNEGTTGYANGGFIDSGYSGAIATEGPIVDGQIIGGSIPVESLFHPDYVGPPVLQSAPTVTSGPIMETLPNPLP